MRNRVKSFTENVDVAISPRFYAWLFGFGTEVEVIYPEEIRAEYADTLGTLKKLYE